MKTFKYFLSVVLFVAAVISCTEEDFGSDAFVSTAVAPANVTALFDVTPDNSGLVTITPNSEGAVSYVVSFGDGTVESMTVKQGEGVEHTYAEGTYEVKMVAKGITGLTTEAVKTLGVSFEAPQNLVVTWSNDEAISNKVNVIADADLGISYDVYFGEEGNDVPETANMGENVSYTYAEPGIYTIRVVAKSASPITTEEILDVEATKLAAPIVKAPTPPGKMDEDVISIFSDAYDDVAISEWNPDWSQTTVLSDFVVEDDASLKYDFFNYTGIVTNYDTGTKLDEMEFVHFDFWTNEATNVGLKLVNTILGGEAEVITENTKFGEWVSVEIPMSEFNMDLTSVTQLVLSSTGQTVFIDNIYFYKAPAVVVDPNVIFDDFEGNGTVLWFEDAATLNDAFANPFIDGDNNSATVLEYNDNGTGQYANIQVRLGQKLDLTLGSVFSLKIYVPSTSITGTQENTLALKLQNNELGGNAWTTQVEIKEPIVLDAWQVVTFDFASAIDRTDLDQIVFQVNGENNFDEVIAYIDDFSYGDSISSGTKLVVFDDFEGNGNVTEWFEDALTLNDALSNPFIDGDNNSATVLEYNDNGTGQYANIQVRLNEKFDLTTGSVFSLKIYVPSSTITGTQENTLALKLQNNELGGNAWTTQFEIKKSIVLDAWQVVTFDFVDAIDRTDFDQIVLQVNGENNFDEVIAYIDDFNYNK